MLKKTKNHNVYEVWCEYTCESVLVDHKPSNEEIKEIIYKEAWDGGWDIDINNFIKKHIVVEKYRKFYTKA